eukprot:2938627-Amphidinium_carterae.1
MKPKASEVAQIDPCKRTSWRNPVSGTRVTRGKCFDSWSLHTSATPQHSGHIIPPLQEHSDKQPSLHNIEKTLVRVLVRPAGWPHKQAETALGAYPLLFCVFAAWAGWTTLATGCSSAHTPQGRALAVVPAVELAAQPRQPVTLMELAS